MTNDLTMMLDHVSLSVADMERAKRFYSAVLATLGMEMVGEVTAAQSGSVAYAGFGIGRKGQLWIAEDGPQTPSAHICFRAPSRQAVRDFHAAGLANGGTDNGAPGIREIYHPEYFAAFVRDPEGHNIEAVTFEPEAGQ
ncbi:MAG: VOC family protein [Hoeflea sp.]|uniref:VOC family protein n=1 Tax=Hoeflea sp. TaxID=1940281 RepID=UPI0032EF47CD